MLLLLCPTIRWHTPQASPRADGIGSDGDDYESLATLVAVVIAAFAKHKDTHNYCSNLSWTRTAAVCDMSVLMHEIDGSEGEDNLLT